jgi:hypothetical protein
MPPDDDSLQRIAALESKVARLEQELAEARLSGQRAAVQQALLDERLLTLEHNRLFRLWGRIYRAAAGLYGRMGIGTRYGGVSDLRMPGDYARWLHCAEAAMAAEDHRGDAARWCSQPLISVSITSGAGGGDSLKSVVEQCYPHWELCLDKESGVRSQESEGRIASGRIVEKPTGEYQLTLHAGDHLSPHALHFYAQALADDSADLVYADEDTVDGGPLFKPGWSPELLRSTMYLGRAVVKRVPAPANPRVRHIARVLYHRARSTPPERTTISYTAPPDARLSLIICSRNIGQVRECLEAVRATVSVAREVLVVHHLESGNGDEMRACVEQFGGTSIPYRGPFDFARMNNLAAAKATAPYLLFLNDDVLVQERGWDQALAATLARPEIGVAGAILQYPNGTIQHAGVVVGMGDAAGHCGRFQMDSELWPWLRMSRDVSAVTGAMLGIRRELFQKMHGFDETFPVNYNDVDLCLRVREAGLRVVCLDVGKVVHRESQTRVGGTRFEEREALYKRWAGVLARGDEFYSAHLAPTERIALGSGERPLRGLV